MSPPRADTLDDRPIIAVSLGDPGGIGPEVALKAAADTEVREAARLLFVGAAGVLRGHAEALGLEAPRIEVVRDVPDAWPRDGWLSNALPVLDVAEDDPDGAAEGGAAEGGGDRNAFSFGEISAAGGRLSMRAVARAVDLCRSGAAHAMTTAPISKAAIARAGYRAPGHTEFIAERVSGPEERFEPLMLMAGRAAIGNAPLRVGLVSVHEPIAEVPRTVTAAAIRRKLGLLARSLRRDFGVDAPRIAVLGLNPHAGDGGTLGGEEQRVIRPAIEAARQEDGLAGVQLDGPRPADGFFGTQGWERADAVLAMYHDQGLGPFKALTFGRGVNVTAGLPVVRTSPDHGTAFDIAGEGRADPGSMKSALHLAAAIARRRRVAASPDSTPRTPETHD